MLVGGFLIFSLDKMECYTTPWGLWRESRNLKVFTEPSLYLEIFSLFVPSTMCMHTCRLEGLPEGLQ